jgi:electron transfer flavoprotein alpha subunit
MIATTQEARGEYRNVWVIAEVLEGKIQKVTYELLGAARALADARAGELWCVVLGSSVEGQLAGCISQGADAVVVVDDPRLSSFIDEEQCSALVRLIKKYLPEIVVCGATTRGRALIPRVAVTANCGLTADCTGLAIDRETGDLLQTRPAFGGNIMATIRCSNHRPQMATVRPRVMNAPAPDMNRKGRIIREALLDSDASRLKKIIEVFHDTASAVNLADARFIVSGGRGLKGPEGFSILKAFADRIGGAVGASRAAVDAGWIPYSHQVGQTGQTVQSKVYIACGISGQIQHLVGMQSCDYIIAIDRDPNTPMMQMADVAIVGDLFEVVPAITAELAKT